MAPVLQTFFNPIFPVFVIMLVGIIFAKARLFNDSDAQAINRFVFYVAVPALLLSLISEADIGSFDYRLLVVYFLSETLLFAAGALVARLLFKCAPGEAILLGMAACFVNHVFFVLPIAQMIYGDWAGIPVTAIIVVDVLVIFGGTIVGFEVACSRDRSFWKIVHVFVKNPVLMALFAGILVNISGLELHEGIRTFTTFAGGAAAPAALFSLGIILANTKGEMLDLPALATAGFKVVLHPLVAWLLFTGVGGFDRLWSDPALLVAAGPSGAMPFVLALQYKVRSQSIGIAIIYSTTASLFTLSFVA